MAFASIADCGVPTEPIGKAWGISGLSNMTAKEIVKLKVMTYQSQLYNSPSLSYHPGTSVQPLEIPATTNTTSLVRSFAETLQIITIPFTVVV